MGTWKSVPLPISYAMEDVGRLWSGIAAQPAIFFKKINLSCNPSFPDLFDEMLQY